ncbi:hypothetical protein ENBRE01_0075 [Enteropsectra breve]|nr:hypothetical protein ENBRE01_0075 [Enteropsectra breve]
MQEPTSTWEEVGTYDTYEMATSVEDKTWSKRDTYVAEGYTRYSFKCITSKGIQCHAKLKVFYMPHTQKFLVQKLGDHHQDCGVSARISNTKIKEEVLELYNVLKLKPKIINQRLLKLGKSISTNKISSIIHRGKALNGMQTTTELTALCASLLAENENLLIKLELKDQKPRICISHKNLISKFRSINHLHIDATYKLIDLGYPVVVIGTTDTNKHFHLVAICICEVESTGSYIWCMDSLKEFYCSLGFVFSPNNVVADCALEITKMQQTCFPGTKRTLCWAHVWRNMSNYITKLPRHFQADFSNDIKFIQKSSSAIIFDSAYDLLQKKWRAFNTTAEFFNEFSTNYFSSGKKVVQRI